MILTLARDNSGRCVGLRLPAEPADIAAAYEKLDAVSTNDRQTRILRADTGVGSLDRWLRDRKMDRPGDYVELGELAEKIGQMNEQQHKQNGMAEQAQEMYERITGGGCRDYYQALGIIGEYVNITGPAEPEESMTMTMGGM